MQEIQNENVDFVMKGQNIKIIDKENELIMDSPDLNAPLKSGIPTVYGYKTIEDCID